MSSSYKPKSRVNDCGRAYAGSQLQIQIYVNRYADELSRRVIHALPSLTRLTPTLHWVSPLEEDKFVEYQDSAFIDAVGLRHLALELTKFWPKGGPNWDALAVVESERDNEKRGVVLVEAKSHPVEIYGSGCQASAGKSLSKIETALEQTQRWLGVREATNWTGRLYQSANRLAHLYFFCEVVQIPAWLVNIYFLGDPHFQNSPLTQEEWQPYLENVKEELGLSGLVVPHTAELFLPAKERSELFRGRA